jgi:GT2 family glycosyltransferase
MNISVVIPNYNGKELLNKNLPKIFQELDKYNDLEKEVIVVDDGSDDESVFLLKELSKKYKNLKFLENKKNLGFSTSVNKGVKASSGEIVILFNTDTYPDGDFLKPLAEDFEDLDLFAVGFMDKSIENGQEVLRGRGLGNWKRGFLIHRRGEVNKTNTLWANGGSSAFRKSIWEKLGGLNEFYNPFYWEDIDLSYRALKSGYKVIFESKIIVYHEHEKGAIRKKYSPFQIKTISYKNQFIFVWENATDFNLQIQHLLYLPYHFIKALTRGDWAFFLGLFKAFILLPKIIKSSFENQALFKKSDLEITKNIQ